LPCFILYGTGIEDAVTAPTPIILVNRCTISVAATYSIYGKVPCTVKNDYENIGNSGIFSNDLMCSFVQSMDKRSVNTWVFLPFDATCRSITIPPKICSIFRIFAMKLRHFLKIYAILVKFP
jgi:hypothetical protein